jgi:calcineurin-like phosphoesterase
MRDPIDNPFTKMDQLLEEIEADHIIVDFHAEATSEKIALAHYLDGRVDAVIGTHTHVPTAECLELSMVLLAEKSTKESGSLFPEFQNV